MRLKDAIGMVIGESLAKSIIADMGVAWGVVAATGDERWETADPAAKNAIRGWLRRQKEPRYAVREIDGPDEGAR